MTYAVHLRVPSRLNLITFILNINYDVICFKIFCNFHCTAAAHPFTMTNTAGAGTSSSPSSSIPSSCHHKACAHRQEGRVIGARVNPFALASSPPNAGNEPWQPLADGERDHKSQYHIHQLNRLPQSWLFMAVGGDRERAPTHVRLIYALEPEIAAHLGWSGFPPQSP